MAQEASWTPGTSPGKMKGSGGLKSLKATEGEGATEFNYLSGSGAKAPQQGNNAHEGDESGHRSYHTPSGGGKKHKGAEGDNSGHRSYHKPS